MRVKKKKFRVVKSLTKKKTKKSSPFYGLTEDNLKDIIKVLTCSFRNVKWSGYFDRYLKYHWCPRLSAANKSGRQFNRELKELIRICRKELKRVRQNPPHNPQDDRDLMANDPFDSHYL